MRTSITSLLTVAMTIFFTSCSQIQVWDPDERSASGRMQNHTIEKLIPVPLDPKRPLDREFTLYYFVRVPDTGRATKNVLFCTGGPGLIIPGPIPGPTFVNFLRDNGYNVVFFHPRGAGFSQIPASNRYDQYLKTSYVVADIEAIRQDFLGKDGKWDAIIGWSYGTVVAQQYAHWHGDNVDRLVLIGPESRHMFNNSPTATAFADFVEAIRVTNRETLESIFYRDEYKENFEYLSDDKKRTIIDGAFGSRKTPGIFDRAEKAFGSLQFVIDSYCELKAQKKLAEFDLDYRRDFFEALRGLRMV